jgi:uncharacterized protein
MSVQGRVVWHDLNTTDIGKAKAFYGELFGWTFRAEGPWNLVHLGTDPGQHFGSINPIPPGLDLPSRWVPYIAVDDIDVALAAAEAGGGRIEIPRSPAGTTGAFAYVADPADALFGLWQYGEGQGPKPEIDDWQPVGNFCWDELLTSDTGAATRFYTAVVGYRAQVLESADGLPYTLWLREAPDPQGMPRNAGGMMTKPPTVPRTMWLPYVQVADCDRSVDAAARLGAAIKMPPTDIPDIGRFATMLDPTMAAVAILQPKP